MFITYIIVTYFLKDHEKIHKSDIAKIKPTKEIQNLNYLFNGRFYIDFILLKIHLNVYVTSPII